MSERYTKTDVRNVWENRFIPAAVSMGFDVSNWVLGAGGGGYSYSVSLPLPTSYFSTVGTSYSMDHIGKTAREAYHTLVNMACAWEAVARVQRDLARQSGECGLCGHSLYIHRAWASATNGEMKCAECDNGICVGE